MSSSLNESASRSSRATSHRHEAELRGARRERGDRLAGVPVRYDAAGGSEFRNAIVMQKSTRRTFRVLLPAGVSQDGARLADAPARGRGGLRPPLRGARQPSDRRARSALQGRPEVPCPPCKVVKARRCHRRAAGAAGRAIRDWLHPERDARRKVNAGVGDRARVAPRSPKRVAVRSVWPRFSQA